MERRLVLLGKTGSGKSAAGNTILRGNYFKSSPVSVTKKCDKKEVEHIKVIDTPEIFNKSLSSDETIKAIVQLSHPGPHAFLLVIRLGRFTEEEKNAVKWIQENFGKGAPLHTIVLFTHADQLGERTLEEFLSESRELKRLVAACGNRYHALNNNDSTPNQVNDLMQKIEDMVKMNGGKHYTIEMPQWTQRENEIVEIAAIVAACAAVGLVAFALAKN